MFDFDDPSHSGRSSPRVGPNTAASAPASIGSPRLVPVPCASIASMSSALQTARRQRRRITRCWLGPFGAVSPWLRPSWFTALPASPRESRRHHARRPTARFSTSTPQPSDHPAPSAPAENALQRPSGAMPAAGTIPRTPLACDITCTPPASARSHSPCRKRRARQVQRHQRRRARRVDRHRRTLKTQHIRHPTRQHARRVPVAVHIVIVSSERVPCRSPSRSSRRTRPCRLSLSASRSVCPHAPAPPTPPPAPAAAAGPSRAPHAARCRRTPRRTARPPSRKPPSRAKPPVASSNRRNNSRLQRLGSGPTPSPPLSRSAQ